MSDFAKDTNVPTNDYISRQAALDAVNDCGICIQKILDLPSAESKWTPVTDGMPKEGNRYIIYHESYGIRIDTRIHGEWKTYGEETVLAWMPLPKPYKVGEQV